MSTKGMSTKASWRDVLALRRKVQEQEAKNAELEADHVTLLEAINECFDGPMLDAVLHRWNQIHALNELSRTGQERDALSDGGADG